MLAHMRSALETLTLRWGEFTSSVKLQDGYVDGWQMDKNFNLGWTILSKSLQCAGVASVIELLEPDPAGWRASSVRIQTK